MHARDLLYKLTLEGCPGIHRRRLQALAVVVDGLLRVRRLGVVAIGRGLAGVAAVKHRIKRVDRLIGNEHLAAQRGACYALMCRWAVSGLAEPVIVVDWSPLRRDRSWHVLRAGLAVRGRTLTLYEEVHPEARLGSRRVQHRFLQQLASMLPSGCTPIVVTDAGFGQPWLQAVSALGWHWVTRLRGRLYLAWHQHPSAWVCLRSLYERASSRARKLGLAWVVRSRPIEAVIVAYRSPYKGRSRKTVFGESARRKHSRYQARRQREPWMLAISPALARRCSPRRIVNLYRCRMQIEEAFRDLKSTRYGYGYPGVHTRSDPRRMANLLLVAALALWLQWCIGWDQRERAHAYQTNSSRRRATAVLSIITTAAIHIQQQGSPHLRRRGLARAMRHLQAINASWTT